MLDSMSFLDRFLSNDPEGLTPPPRITDVEVPGLRIFTAEALVILTLPLSSLAPLRAGLGKGGSLRLLTAGQRPVSLITGVHDRALPTLDPVHGWLIPCSVESRTELLALLSAARPGDHELSSVNLAMVLEDS